MPDDTPAARMMELVEQWRSHANYLADQIRRGNYVDQASRVRVAAEMKILRRCARQLKREAKSNG